MRLIDADRLQKTISLTQSDNDRPPSPYPEYGSMYFYEISDMVDNEPEIDPVHAAGGCYCRECNYFMPYTLDGYFICTKYRHRDFEGSYLVEPDGFCYYGDPKEE